eukprot:gene4438-biopygen10880
MKEGMKEKEELTPARKNVDCRSLTNVLASLHSDFELPPYWICYLMSPLPIGSAIPFVQRCGGHQNGPITSHFMFYVLAIHFAIASSHFPLSHSILHKVAFPTKRVCGTCEPGGTARPIWRHGCMAAQDGGTAAQPSGMAAQLGGTAARRHVGTLSQLEFLRCYEPRRGVKDCYSFAHGAVRKRAVFKARPGGARLLRRRLAERRHPRLAPVVAAARLPHRAREELDDDLVAVERAVPLLLPLDDHVDAVAPLLLVPHEADRRRVLLVDLQLPLQEDPGPQRRAVARQHRLDRLLLRDVRLPLHPPAGGAAAAGGGGRPGGDGGAPPAAPPAAGGVGRRGAGEGGERRRRAAGLPRSLTFQLPLGASGNMRTTFHNGSTYDPPRRCCNFALRPLCNRK